MMNSEQETLLTAEFEDKKRSGGLKSEVINVCLFEGLDTRPFPVATGGTAATNPIQSEKHILIHATKVNLQPKSVVGTSSFYCVF